MKAICINLPSRQDRWEQVQQEFEKLPFKVERFEPIPHPTPYISFNLTMAALIAGIKEPTWIFEDDVQFINMEQWEVAMDIVPYGFDLLYLGGNVREPLKKANDRWYRVQNTWTTHAILYTPKAAGFIQQVFEPEGMIYDEQLRTKVQPYLKCYICKPYMAVQRPSHSDIWGVHADYGILATQKLLP
ncbi:hypothetical protein UFOVP402_7 [uncultured Caudovirales phage]|uniref:Uncharacterized protein n=1 Tax=uncultured Caudovirales phage TaxID=2100421 RepID=A0A6J5M0F1_9CAUD|nr:hypothetical protein UFOVP402_7 [uncultured Caudovirales phage]